MKRRTFPSSGILLAHQVLSPGGAAWAFRERAGGTHAHDALRIEPYKLEIARGVVVGTVAYNGQVPGPILRERQGVSLIVNVTNRTAKDNPGETLLHCHQACTWISDSCSL
jgi:FtsP/CotA-like multicopper oxidase with cupredoxin domain